MYDLSFNETQGVLDALGAILASLVDGVILFDREERVLLANPAAGRLLGRPAEPLVDETLATLLQPASRPDQREAVIRRLRERQPHSGLKLDWTGGQVFSISLTPVWRSPGRLLGVVTIIRDVTREAELERLKSTFVSMVSHELRTPLVAILSQTELLNFDDEPLATEQQVAVDHIEAHAQRLLRLVGDLLDQTQIETGRLLVLRPTAFAPADLLAELRAALAGIAADSAIALTCRVAADLPARLMGDPQRLLQILINLAGNALKFTEAGEVQVTLTRPDAAHWQIEVADTGPGIPAARQAQIFESFYHAGPQAGVGLGLTIVKHLVGLMAGDIQLDSAPGQGSRFTVRLPLVVAAVAVSPVE